MWKIGPDDSVAWETNFAIVLLAPGEQKKEINLRFLVTDKT